MVGAKFPHPSLRLASLYKIEMSSNAGLFVAEVEYSDLIPLATSALVSGIVQDTSSVYTAATALAELLVADQNISDPTSPLEVF